MKMEGRNKWWKGKIEGEVDKDEKKEKNKKKLEKWGNKWEGKRDKYVRRTGEMTEQEINRWKWKEEINGEREK